jgi:hypothetical protein
VPEAQIRDLQRSSVRKIDSVDASSADNTPVGRHWAEVAILSSPDGSVTGEDAPVLTEEFHRQRSIHEGRNARAYTSVEA